MTKLAFSNLRSAIVLGLIALLALAAFFSGLSIPFAGPDEPRYAQVAREMLERGDWFTPTLGGHTWFEKPVLLYWFEIVFFNLFGVNEFAARLGPTLCGLGTVISLWFLGQAEGRGLRTANTFALIGASTLSIIGFSHGASFDIVVTFPITAALAAYFISDRGDSEKPTTTLAIFYFFVGLALLAKGLIGIVIPFGVVGIYHLLSRRLPSRKFMISLSWGLCLTTAVAAAWYLPMFLRHGWPFIDEFFVQHHFQRFTSNRYNHPQPFYFYLWVLPLMTLPWLPFVFAGLWPSVRTAFRPRLADGSSPLLLFSLSWLVVPLAFFSFSGSKLPGYILPAVPAAIALAGCFIRDRSSAKKGWRLATIVIACAAFVFVICLAQVAAPRYADGDTVKGLIESAAARGYASERVFGLHTVSHSAEFYSAGRLLRAPDGSQKKLESPSDLRAAMQQASVARALVLVPLKYVDELSSSGEVQTDVIRDNGELAIIAVTLLGQE